MNYIPLNITTSYTFLKSSISICKLIDATIEYKLNSVAICDFNVMYGFAEFNKIAKENGINPIFGMKIKLDDTYLNLYIKNEYGYQNLCFISNYISRYKNITKDIIKDKTKGIIAIIPTLENNIFDSIDDKTFSHNLNTFAKLFNEFYIGLEIYTLNDLKKADLIRNFATQYSYQIVAFPKVLYIKKNEAISIKILNAIEKQTTFDYKEEINDNFYYYKKIDELKTYYSDEELNLTSIIFKNNDFEFIKKRGELLHFNNEINSETLLKEKIYEGLKFRNINLNTNKNYKDRLNYEFLTIKKMGYCNYFLIVQDYVLYAKTHNIPVGPGRGSAAGSLISYLLQITEVDPLKYNLLFERFLNPQRKTMPDIDIDISDQKRDDVIQYLFNKWGDSRCSKIVAFQTFGAKQALRDITKVFGYPNNIADSLSKTIPTIFSNKNTLDECYKKIPQFKETINSVIDYKAIFKAAKMIEGLPRQRGLHAAGIILNNENLETKIPLIYDDALGFITQYEKDFLEEQGFLKMDILGLTNLSTIDNCLKLIKKEKNIDLSISNIPYNEEEIFELINNHQTMGIFQLDTDAALNAVSSIKPANFNDVVATISLDRPGPMSQIPLYSKRKNNKEKISYIDPSLEPILKDTYGIIIYQEQIMQIVREFCGFSFADADLFRRAISKKHVDEMIKMKEKFVQGALKKGKNIDVINKIYQLILKFAEYGFNKSHAVSYAMIACKECYLKANFPAQFYISILDEQFGSNDIKFNKYLSEMKKAGLSVLLPNINLSTTHFELYNNSLLMPLIGINELPTRTILNILKEREKNGKYSSFIDFVTRMFHTEEKISETQLAKLIDAGVFDTLYSNRKSLKMSIPSALQYASTSIYYEGKLLDNFGIEFNLIDTEDDIDLRIENELNALGVMISDTPLNHIDKSYFDNKKVTLINDLNFDTNSTIRGIIRSIKIIEVKKGKDKGKPMAFLTLFDETGDIDVTIFSSQFEQYQSDLKVNSIVIVEGKLQKRNDKESFTINSLKKVK